MELLGGEVELYECEMEFCDGSRNCIRAKWNCMGTRWNCMIAR